MLRISALAEMHREISPDAVKARSALLRAAKELIRKAEKLIGIHGVAHRRYAIGRALAKGEIPTDKENLTVWKKWKAGSRARQRAKISPTTKSSRTGSNTTLGVKLLPPDGQRYLPLGCRCGQSRR
jgi:hypothetical protein